MDDNAIGVYQVQADGVVLEKIGKVGVALRARAIA
jgi:hypothetical protein